MLIITTCTTESVKLNLGMALAYPKHISTYTIKIERCKTL